MLRWFCLIAWGVVVVGGTSAGAEGPAPLKILYAGNPGSDRERDYVGFLKGTFPVVDAVDYRTFREEMADGHDVVIFDWTSIQKRDASGRVDEKNPGMAYPKPIPHPGENYSRPTILIGGAGEEVIRPLKLKIDWGCLCLGDYAHGMKLEHPIFQEPYAVAPPIETIPMPSEYHTTAGSKPLGPTIQAWRVQTPLVADLDPGLVARGDEFEEAPDAEAISSGTNMKGPEMVALGRHGNYFLWGFAAPPSEMSPAGRNCFLNVVHYIKRFDGQKPVVRKTEQGTITRRQVRHVAEFAPTVLDPDGLRNSSPAYASYEAEKYRRVRDMKLRLIRKLFPAEVNVAAASIPSSYLAWVEANDRWLIPGGYDESDGIRAIAVDEDLKALGLDNRAVATLDACVGMLGEEDKAESALRILKRYTGQDFAALGDWRNWLDQHRDRLAFTEVGGFQWVVADSADAAHPVAGVSMPLEPPGPAHKLFDPVKLAGSVEPSRASGGQVATVSFRLEIAGRWHVAAAGVSLAPRHHSSSAWRCRKGWSRSATGRCPPPHSTPRATPATRDRWNSATRSASNPTLPWARRTSVRQPSSRRATRRRAGRRCSGLSMSPSKWSPPDFVKRWRWTVQPDCKNVVVGRVIFST